MKKPKVGRFILTVPVAQILDVTDGDTFKLISFNVAGYVRIRVLPVQAPEKGSPGFVEAKAFLAEWLHQGPFQIDTTQDDSFGRHLAVVTRGNENVGELMIEKGLGVLFKK